jgi:hypothetical protein
VLRHVLHLTAVVALVGLVVGLVVAFLQTPPTSALTGYSGFQYEGPVAPSVSLAHKVVCTQQGSGEVCIDPIAVKLGTASAIARAPRWVVNGIPTPRRVVTIMSNSSSGPYSLSFTAANTFITFEVSNGLQGIQYTGTGVTLDSVLTGPHCAQRVTGPLVLAPLSSIKVCIGFGGVVRNSYAPKGTSWGAMTIGGIAQWERVLGHRLAEEFGAASPQLVASTDPNSSIDLTEIAPWLVFPSKPYGPSSGSVLRGYGLSMHLANTDGSSLVNMKTHWFPWWQIPTTGPVVLELRLSVARGVLATSSLGDSFVDFRTNCSRSGCSVLRLRGVRTTALRACAVHTGTTCFEFRPPRGSLPVRGALAVTFDKGVYNGQRALFTWGDDAGWTRCVSARGPCR